jgi:hypothetical protein
VGVATDLKGLAATTEHAITQNESGTIEAATKAAVARERIERIDRGEDVQGGLGRPLTTDDLERMLVKCGLTKSDIRHCEWVNKTFTELERFPGAIDEWWEAFHRPREAGERRIERLALGDVLRKRGLRWVPGDADDEEGGAEAEGGVGAAAEEGEP